MAATGAAGGRGGNGGGMRSKFFLPLSLTASSSHSSSGAAVIAAQQRAEQVDSEVDEADDNEEERAATRRRSSSSSLVSSSGARGGPAAPRRRRVSSWLQQHPAAPSSPPRPALALVHAYPGPVTAAAGSAIGMTPVAASALGKATAESAPLSLPPDASATDAEFVQLQQLPASVPARRAKPPAAIRIVPKMSVVARAQPPKPSAQPAAAAATASPEVVEVDSSPPLSSATTAAATVTGTATRAGAASATGPGTNAQTGAPSQAPLTTPPARPPPLLQPINYADPLVLAALSEKMGRSVSFRPSAQARAASGWQDLSALERAQPPPQEQEETVPPEDQEEKKQSEPAAAVIAAAPSVDKSHSNVELVYRRPAELKELSKKKGAAVTASIVASSDAPAADSPDIVEIHRPRSAASLIQPLLPSPSWRVLDDVARPHDDSMATILRKSKRMCLSRLPHKAQQAFMQEQAAYEMRTQPLRKFMRGNEMKSVEEEQGAPVPATGRVAAATAERDTIDLLESEEAEMAVDDDELVDSLDADEGQDEHVASSSGSSDSSGEDDHAVVLPSPPSKSEKTGKARQYAMHSKKNKNMAVAAQPVELPAFRKSKKKGSASAVSQPSESRELRQLGVSASHARHRPPKRPRVAAASPSPSPSSSPSPSPPSRMRTRRQSPAAETSRKRKRPASTKSTSNRPPSSSDSSDSSDSSSSDDDASSSSDDDDSNCSNSSSSDDHDSDDFSSDSSSDSDDAPPAKRAKVATASGKSNVRTRSKGPVKSPPRARATRSSTHSSKKGRSKSKAGSRASSPTSRTHSDSTTRVASGSKKAKSSSSQAASSSGRARGKARGSAKSAAPARPRLPPVVQHPPWRIQQVQKLKEWQQNQLQQQKKLRKQELKQKQKLKQEQNQIQLKQASSSAPRGQRLLPLLVLDDSDDDDDQDEDAKKSDDEPQISLSVPSQPSVETSAAPGAAPGQSELGSSPAHQLQATEPAPVGIQEDASSTPIGKEEDDEASDMRATSSSVAPADVEKHISKPLRSPNQEEVRSPPLLECGEGDAALPFAAVGQLSDDDVRMADASNEEAIMARQGSNTEVITADAGVPSRSKSPLTPEEPVQRHVTPSPSQLQAPEEPAPSQAARPTCELGAGSCLHGPARKRDDFQLSDRG